MYIHRYPAYLVNSLLTVFVVAPVSRCYGINDAQNKPRNENDSKTNSTEKAETHTETGDPEINFDISDFDFNNFDFGFNFDLDAVQSVLQSAADHVEVAHMRVQLYLHVATHSAVRGTQRYLFERFGVDLRKYWRVGELTDKLSSDKSPFVSVSTTTSGGGHKSSLTYFDLVDWEEGEVMLYTNVIGKKQTTYDYYTIFWYDFNFDFDFDFRVGEGVARVGKVDSLHCP